jgi:hypothetical protein
VIDGNVDPERIPGLRSTLGVQIAGNVDRGAGGAALRDVPGGNHARRRPEPELAHAVDVAVRHGARTRAPRQFAPSLDAGRSRRGWFSRAGAARDAAR